MTSRKKATIIALTILTLIYATGFYLVDDVKLSLGVLAFIWGNNLERKFKWS